MARNPEVEELRRKLKTLARRAFTDTKAKDTGHAKGIYSRIAMSQVPLEAIIDITGSGSDSLTGVYDYSLWDGSDVYAN